MVKHDLAYAADEKVLCFHGPLVYEAKIKKAELWSKEDNKHGFEGPHYLMHYKGWKNTWDEWVPESRLLKLNEENIAKQKQLTQAQAARDKLEREAAAAAAGGKDVGNKKRPSEATPSSSRGTKRAREAAPEQEEEYMKRPEIKIWIPDELKVLLVDDWEAITKNNQLVPLPRTPNVQQILDDFEEHSKKEKTITRDEALTHEVTAGLKLYFDKSLGSNLLYRFERNQYGEQRRKHGEEADPSTYYGAEHLLRLFVNLPELIAHTNMDADSVTVLKDALADFLKFMAKEHKRLFCSMDQYENTSSAYQNVART